MKAIPLLLLAALVGCAPARADEIKAIDGVELSRAQVPDVLAALLKKTTVTDFAYATPTTILYVENQRLGVLNTAVKGAKTAAPVQLPAETTRIAVGKAPGFTGNSVYAYGRKSGKDAIYAYEGAGKFKKLAETPKPITAAALAGNRILFAMDNAIFSLRPGQGAQVIFASDLVRGIRSIAFDSELDIVYFSNAKQVYALRSGMADVILQGYGGALEVQGSDLLIQNRGETALLRVTGLKELLQKSG